MAETVGDHVLARLREWGVEQVFGYPGDGINGMLGAFGTRRRPAALHPGPARGDGGVRGRRVRQVLRHAPASAWPPRARVRSTCSTGSTTPSSTTCRSSRSSGRPTAARWAAPTSRRSTCWPVQGRGQRVPRQRSPCPQQLPNVLDRAIRTALARRAPTAVIIPSDVQELDVLARPAHAFKRCPRARPSTLAATLSPDDRGSSGPPRSSTPASKVAILVGQGARGAAAEVEQVADLLGAGVAKALLGKDVLPDDLPFVTGSIGLLGTRPSYELMRDCDTLLIVGSNFPYTPVPARVRPGAGRADRHRRRA